MGGERSHHCTIPAPDYVRYIEEFVISRFVISRFYSIHFTVTLAETKNIVRYIEDFVKQRFVKSRFHCTENKQDQARLSFFIIFHKLSTASVFLITVTFLFNYCLRFFLIAVTFLQNVFYPSYEHVSYVLFRNLHSFCGNYLACNLDLIEIYFYSRHISYTS